MINIKDPGVAFSDKGHVYTTPSGEMYTGVTTILGVRSKDFLLWWSVKEMYTYMSKNWDINKQYTEKEKDDLLLLGKKAHTMKSKDALNTGTIVHDWIEKHIIDPTHPMPDDPVIRSIVEPFVAWEALSGVGWLKTELVVASHAHQFAGTLDALAIVDKKLTLLDFKTSSQMSEEYFLQTAGYQIALEEMGVVPEQRMIIRIPKDVSPIEAIVVPTPLQFDKETFLHLREVHRWNINIINNFKDKDGKLLCCQNLKNS